MTEALNHYLDQRDEDYERQREIPHPNYECGWDGCWCRACLALQGYEEEENMMNEKTMIVGAKVWMERCETNTNEEVQNGVIYVRSLLAELAKEIESRDGWKDAWKKNETEKETLRRVMENTHLFNSVFIERFHRYAKHLGGCTWDDGTKGDVCTCGFQGLVNLYYEIQDAFIREKS